MSFPADIFPSLIIVNEPEAVAQTCSVKKVFLEISQNSQENTCVKVSLLIKLPGLATVFQLYYKETLAQVLPREI